MSVADILQAMAENAGRSRLQRGALIGNAVSAAAQVPAQIIEDQTKDALLKRRQAIENEQLGFQRNADTRAQSDQSAQDQATKLATARANALKLGIAAGFGNESDPKKFDEAQAIKAVTEAGFPDLAPAIVETHKKLLPALTSGAPGSVMRDASGVVVPGSEIPANKPDYTVNGQRFSGSTNQPLGAPVTPQVTPAAAQTHNMRLDGVGDVPVDYVPNKDGSGGKWMYQGGDVTGKVKAIPPASIQINNAAAGTSTNQASAAEKAIAHYMLPPISPRSMQTPSGKAMMDRILTENPDYDASKFSVRADIRKKYTTGPQGQQIASINTAVEHLDLLQAAADSLKNGEFKPGNALFNRVKDTFGSSAPTTFDAIKEKVDKELDAVASKGVPTVSGAASQKEIGGKASSPEAIKAYIDTSIKLMGSSLESLVTPYKREMGDKDPFNPLTPGAQDVLTKRGFDATTLRQQTQPAAVAVPANVATALKGASPGKHTLSDGSVWIIAQDGSVTKGT
jgi:hypothetical protein